MSTNEIPRWFPKHPPIYDISKTYAENAELGPFFKEAIPPRTFPPKNRWHSFLDQKIASPIGVPAGPLLNSNWIKLAAELGFDIVTYKTIRSKTHPAHPLPNMIYVNTHGMVTHGLSQIANRIPKPTDTIEDLAVTNSFGMPSMSPEFLLEDIPRANGFLKPGQVMIVSVVGTQRPERHFLDDFVDTARLAKEAGAKLIEANFSCPNVDKREGCLYMSPQTVRQLGEMLVKAVAPIPLIIKVGTFSSTALLTDVMVEAARAGIRGFCGINSFSMQVLDESGKPALGSRATSGVCGGPIREAALQFIKEAHRINVKEKLDLTLVGVGGITLPEHFDLFLDNGARAALSATGMIWDPFLAMRYHNQKR